MVTARIYNKDDYTKIMDFLREMYEKNQNQHCWLPSRWEYAEHLVNPLYIERGEESWEKYIRIWEEDSKIVGIAHPEETYNAFLQIRPGYRELEPEMLDWAEKAIAKPTENNNKKLVIWANESDQYRHELLTKRGYGKGKECSYLNKIKLDDIYNPGLPPGYKFRSMDEEISFVKRYNVINKAFHPKEDFVNEVPESFMKMVQAPMYRPDLDLIIEEEEGKFASSCVIWFDEENKIGMFEPVGTHPNHKRKGLGKALIEEGLRRLKEIGAETAYVEAYGSDRRAFYQSAGFKAYDQDYPWTKVFEE